MTAQKAARVDDTIDHGGKIIQGSPNCIHGSSGKAYARVGDQVACDLHGTVTITAGSPTAEWNNKAAARIGSLCSCGAKIITGADNVLINT